jgi:hypothetical protein
VDKYEFLVWTKKLLAREAEFRQEKTFSFYQKELSMIKRLISMSVLASLQAFAVPTETVFSCLSHPEGETFGMSTIRFEDELLLSQLTGSSDNSLIETMKETLTSAEAVQVGGVVQIMNTLGLSQNDFSQAVIYTAGNFDDDVAGVRGVEFQDANGHKVNSGMFFGWAGPMGCESEAREF